MTDEPRIGFRAKPGLGRVGMDSFQQVKQALAKAIADAQDKGFVAVAGVMQPGRLERVGNHTSGRWYGQCVGDHMGITGLLQLISSDVDSEMERNLEREGLDDEDDYEAQEGPDGHSGSVILPDPDGEWDELGGSQRQPVARSNA